MLYVGTSGYSYKEWKGNFYPEKISAKDMLSYYGERFLSVEINNTFYRLPRSEILEGWAEQVPGDFRFVLKASRRITHFKRLQSSGDEVEYLVRTARSLGSKLGAILYQLPPNLKKDADRLTAFLEELPDSPGSAFEFRHESWFDDEVYALLRSRNCALCVSDNDDFETPLVSTADWGYLRLRRANYRKPDLQRWAAAPAEQGWKDTYVFFKHEDEGAGPKLAKRYLELSAA